MADCMMFPKDWHDFIKDYSFIDSERVYTNGSELIQVLRVTQLIEHLLKEQQNQIWELQDQVEYFTDKQKEHETTDTNDLRVFHCKKCGYGIEDIFISDEHNYTLVPKFCPNCGRTVKHE